MPRSPTARGSETDNETSGLPASGADRSIKAACSTYDPGETVRNLNLPLASVIARGRPTGSIVETNNPVPVGSTFAIRVVAPPGGWRSIVKSLTGPSGPTAMPDTSTVGANRTGTSIPARASPEPSVMTVASAGLGVPGYIVV